jgi:hypothetical protein
VLPAHTIGLFTSLSVERKKLIKQKRRFADLEKRVLACVNFRLCFAKEQQKMPDDEWITTLADGRKVKFTNQELLEDRAFITAQVAGNKVVYSIVLAKIRIPPGREEVESYFEDELSKK